MPSLRSVLVPVLALIAALTTAYAAHEHPGVPVVHDEFSYLLAADTLLAGRVANDPHSLWPHFETMHVLQQPTYASKYPILQGVILALGTLLGNPLFGVFLSFALAAAALHWMLRAWLPANAALVAALMFALHPQIVMFWGTWYWGGAAAFTGGALVFGALPRLLSAPRARHGALFAAGAAILALTRPFEGLVACVLAGLALGASVLLRREPDASSLIRGFVVPVSTGLLLLTGWFALANQRTTGRATTLPYVEHARQYAAVPDFLFLERGPLPTYRHAALHYFYAVDSAAYFGVRQTWRGYRRGLRHKAVLYADFFTGGWALGILLCASLLALRRRAVRFAWLALLVFSVALAVETFELPHYAAPLAPLLFFLFGAGWQRLARIRAGSMLVAALLVIGFFQNVASAREHLERRNASRLNQRPALISDLERRGGTHLVIVRTGEGHDVHEEWVWNAADIDAAPVIWAREMDPARDRELVRHFAEREVWLFDPDREPLAPVTHPRAEDWR